MLVIAVAPGMQQLQQDPQLRERLATQGRSAFLKYWSEAAVIPVFPDVVKKSAQRTRRMDIVSKLEEQ